MQDDVVERLLDLHRQITAVLRPSKPRPAQLRVKQADATTVLHAAVTLEQQSATILSLREQLEKAEGALRECQSAIGDWSRPTGANGMTTPAEDHPLLWVMGLVRAYFAAQQSTLQQIKDTPA